ncbi:MAG TPA: OmpH family outer membrane protein [Acidobacteriota bacterium]|nr:OmpH family outer membrane protein [Acidobacteriota bacterium]
MKYWLVVLSLALSSSFAAAQERVKIGFIDVQRVIAESQPGKRAKDRFQAQVKKAEADIQKERQELERIKADIDKKGPLLKEEERRNMEADFQKRSVNLQRTMGDYQQELRQKESEMMSEILKELESVVGEVGKADKFTLILERSQILYSDQGIDITNKVIESYNSRAKK